MDFQQHKYLSLRTFRRSGSPVDTPVWFASADRSRHYVFSAADAGKVKRLRNSSSIEVATCDARGGSLGLWVSGHGFLVDNQEEQALAYRLLHAKYGWVMWMTDLFSRLSGRIHNRQVIRLEFVA